MQATTSRNPQRTTCPRCDGALHPGHLLCTACFRAEPITCRRCDQVDYLLAGLCATCAVEDAAILDLDPDAPIPFELTPRALAALAAPPPVPHGEQPCRACGRYVAAHTGYERPSDRAIVCAACFGRRYAPTVTRDATPPQNAPESPHGASGEAACPRCGKVRGVVYDGERTRCFGCHRHWIPTAPTGGAA
jgi:hypothetical protein